MSVATMLLLTCLVCTMTLASYVDRIYAELGRFMGREYQDNTKAWEERVEPRLRLGRESIALSASFLRQISLAGIALLLGFHLYPAAAGQGGANHAPELREVLLSLAELVLLTILFDRLIPQLLFIRTRGRWIEHLRLPLQGLFVLMLPMTLLLGLLLSIAALAEPEHAAEQEHPSEAMDALLEAGEEEGILEESDRELVRSVVEFGDKLVREVMTPRPEIFAVPGSMTLQRFTEAIEQHAFSRVPVHGATPDEITGIAFAHDLLQVADSDAAQRTVAELERPAAFVPETKNVAELLREMQREKQHMRIVIDEYGGVAGLVTIEDLLEAIVGEISDEHDAPDDADEPSVLPDGSLIVSGTLEIPRLRDALLEQLRTRLELEADAANAPAGTAAGDGGTAREPDTDGAEAAAESERAESQEDGLQRLGDGYEATTLGGLVSEMAGHIPHPGEVVEENSVRFEVLAATDRRIDRIRVSLVEQSEESRVSR